jgi:hypothetical protein
MIKNLLLGVGREYYYDEKTRRIKLNVAKCCTYSKSFDS